MSENLDQTMLFSELSEFSKVSQFSYSPLNRLCCDWANLYKEWGLHDPYTKTFIGVGFWKAFLKIFFWPRGSLGQAKMIFSFASQEKNVHPLPGLLGCFFPTRQGFYFDIIVPPGRVFITIYLQGNRLGVRCLRLTILSGRFRDKSCRYTRVPNNWGPQLIDFLIFFAPGYSYSNPPSVGVHITQEESLIW